jgi:hypothetical protein
MNGINIIESYLKSKFLNDIDFLFKRLKMNIENDQHNYELTMLIL